MLAKYTCFTVYWNTINNRTKRGLLQGHDWQKDGKDMNRFKTIFSVASESHMKKLLTFRRWQCLTTASAISCFFNDVQFICNDLASIFSSAAGKQSTASCTVPSSESCKQTQNIDERSSHYMLEVLECTHSDWLIDWVRFNVPPNTL